MIYQISAPSNRSILVIFTNESNQEIANLHLSWLPEDPYLTARCAVQSGNAWGYFRKSEDCKGIQTPLKSAGTEGENIPMVTHYLEQCCSELRLS